MDPDPGAELPMPTEPRVPDPARVTASSVVDVSPSRHLSIALLVGAVVLAACTGGGGSSPPPDGSSTTTRPAPPTSTTTTLPPVADALGTLSTAVATHDPSALDSAARVAVPGSPAAEYLGFQSAVLSVIGEQPPGRVEPAGTDSFRVCDISQSTSTCRVLSDPVFGPDGRLENFTIDGISLDGRITSDGPEVASSDVRMQAVAALQAIPSGDLVVVVEVRNLRDSAILVNAFAAVYRSPDGGRMEVRSTAGDDRAEPGDGVRFLVVVPSSPVGGLLEVPGTSDGFDDPYLVRVPVSPTP